MTRPPLGEVKKKAYLEMDSNTCGAVVIAPPPRMEHGVFRILEPLALTTHLEGCPAHPLEARVERVAFHRLALVEARFTYGARHRLKDVACVWTLRGDTLLLGKNKEKEVSANEGRVKERKKRKS